MVTQMQQEEQRKCLAVVRIRSDIGAMQPVKDTLKMLHLTRTNYATLIDNRQSYVGMITTAQHYVTWGEVSKENIQRLLEKSGRLVGDKKITGEYTASIGYKSIGDLAEALHSCKVEYAKLPNIKPVFRLRPPSKGYKGKTKKSYRMGGESGYRGEAINELLKRTL